MERAVSAELIIARTLEPDFRELRKDRVIDAMTPNGMVRSSEGFVAFCFKERDRLRSVCRQQKRNLSSYGEIEVIEGNWMLMGAVSEED